MLDKINDFMALAEIEELLEYQEDDYEEAGLVDVTTYTMRAGLISVNFGTASTVITNWFPFSQMRKLSGELYLSKWILREKGISS